MAAICADRRTTGGSPLVFRALLCLMLAPPFAPRAACQPADIVGRIEGTITDAATGVPLANVGVLFNQLYEFPVAYTETDASGHYISPPLFASLYSVATNNVQGFIDTVVRSGVNGGST